MRLNTVNRSDTLYPTLRMSTSTLDLTALKEAFGERLQLNVPLARYTTPRLGGPADALLVANTANDLAEIASRLWKLDVPFWVLGNGSNVLVSDAGVRGVVVLNRSRQVRFNDRSSPPTVWAESGTNFGALARQAAARGLAGLEWAAGIPGTVGGAVVGNAGAHGGDLAGNLLVADILQRTSLNGLNSQTIREEWATERFDFTYRNSWLKRNPQQVVILATTLKLVWSTPEAAQSKIEEFSAYRHRTQPPGASMGSMFKNPPGDYAGRLIDAAGLKGTKVGEAEISSLHANFFINRGQARAADIYALLNMAHNLVLEKFGTNLELEIELLGEWSM
jgi:UDP-N-acetylmuramate dehydrogenase